MLKILHKRDSDFYVNRILVESVLYHGGKAIIAGDKHDYGTCLDQRIEFMDIKSVKELIGKRSIFSILSSKVKRKNKEDKKDTRTVVIIPDMYRIKIREVQEYIVLSCDKLTAEYIIVYLNLNQFQKSSAYERLLENSKKALF